MGLKYYITVVDKKTSTVHHLERDENTVNATIIKELGGWDNLHTASTGGAKVNHLSKDYYMAGTTRNNSKGFSILCITLHND